MIFGPGGELGRRQDGDARAARAAGVRPGFRVVYPNGAAPVTPRQPAAEAPRTSWAAPSEGPGVWSVGGTSAPERAPERRGSGAAVVFLVVMLAVWAYQCFGGK